jgi:tetratricopeptide (TPR) repeat protein
MKKLAILFLLVLSVLLSLTTEVGCRQQAETSPVPTSTPTPTPALSPSSPTPPVAPPSPMPSPSPTRATAVECVERGIALAKEGRYDQAIAEYTKAIELDPKYALAYCFRGDAYGKTGKSNLAIADYTKAIELDPEGAEANWQLGEAYIDKGQYDQAIDDCNTVLKLTNDPSLNHAAQQLLITQQLVKFLTESGGNSE